MSLPARIYLGTYGYVGHPYYAYVLNSVTGAIEQIIELGTSIVGGGTRGIAADFAGRVYIVGYETPTIRKFHPNGTLLWSADHGAKVDRVVVDSSGNVFIAGEAVNNAGTIWDSSQNASVSWVNGTSTARAGYYTTRKYNSDGVLQWSADHSYSYNGLRGIAVDSTGAVYTIGDSFAMAGIVPPLTKYNSDGTIAWRGSLSNTLHTSIAIDSNDNVYVGGREYNSYFLEKYNSSGTILQQKLPLTESLSPVVFIKIIGSSLFVIQENTVVTEYDLDLNVITVHPEFSGSINICYEFDTEGHGYCGLRSSGFSPYYHARSYTISTGVNRWTISCTSDADYIPASAIAVVDVGFPGLEISLSLGANTTQGYVVNFSPALSFPLSLGVPFGTWTLNALIAPQVIYRVWLTGGTGPIELSVSTFTCRRRLNGSLVLSVSCHGFSSSLIQDIDDRMSGYLIVNSGYRFSNDQEQLIELARVPLSTVSWDQTQDAIKLMLGGQTTDESSTNQKTILAKGISYRNAINGIRRIRCLLDFNLRPGDYLNLGGGELLLADEISYTISVNDSIMEVAEAE